MNCLKKKDQGSVLEYGLDSHLKSLNEALEKGLPGDARFPERDNEWIKSRYDHLLPRCFYQLSAPLLIVPVFPILFRFETFRFCTDFVRQFFVFPHVLIFPSERLNILFLLNGSKHLNPNFLIGMKLKLPLMNVKLQFIDTMMLLEKLKFHLLFKMQLMLRKLMDLSLSMVLLPILQTWVMP
jgi:hypothetical protein